jgi:mannosyltransferase
MFGMDDAPTSDVGLPASSLDVGPRTSVRGHVRVPSLVGAIAIASGTSVALGLTRIGSPPLWIDESYTARAVGYSFTGLWEQVHLAYYAIVKSWTSLAGTSEWALRVPSVFAAALACGLLVLLGDRLFERRVALVAGVFMAASPFVVQWSQQARSYTLVLAVSILAVLLLVRAVERASREAWTTYGIGFAAVMVLHPVSGVSLIVPHALYALQRRHRLVPHALLAPIVVVCVAMPWVGVVAFWTRGEDSGVAWIDFPTTRSVLETLREVSGAAGLGIALAIVGLHVLRRAGRTDLAIWLATWACAPLVVTLLVSLVKPMFLDRYLIVVAPAFALLAAIAIVGVSARLRLPVIAVAAVFTIAGLAHWYWLGTNGNWRGEDWRAAAREVLTRRKADEPVLAVPWPFAAGASYYGVSVVDVSTADSVWVLRWSEEGGLIRHSERSGLGLGEYRLVERLDFGWRLSLQHWSRPR